MSNDLEDRGARALARVDLAEEWECHYWSAKLGIPDEELKKIVGEVGDRVEDVERLVVSAADLRLHRI